MTEFDPGAETPSIASVTDRVRQFALGAPAASAFFLGDTLAVVGAEESVTLISAAGETSRVEVSFGAILCAASDGKRVVIGGDDGKLVAIDAQGATTTLATDPKRRWIDNVALHPDGAVAWSAGKTAFIRPPKGEEKTLDVPTTVGGLAFAPKGLRLAIAHYNGVTLWFPEHGGEARSAGMGRLASRRDVQPRQQVPGDVDARAGAARLATLRRRAHADDRLSRPGALDVVDVAARGSPPPAPTA